MLKHSLISTITFYNFYCSSTDSIPESLRFSKRRSLCVVSSCFAYETQSKMLNHLVQCNNSRWMPLRKGHTITPHKADDTSTRVSLIPLSMICHVTVLLKTKKLALDSAHQFFHYLYPFPIQSIFLCSMATSN